MSRYLLEIHPGRECDDIEITLHCTECNVMICEYTNHYIDLDETNDDAMGHTLEVH